MVKAGQPLYQLDDDTYRADLGAPARRWSAREAALRVGEAQRPPLRGAGAGGARQQAGQRQRAGGAAAGRGRREVRARPRLERAEVVLQLRADHLAHHRAASASPRSPRARWSPRTRRRRWPPCSSSTRSTWTSPSRAASSCTLRQQLAAGSLERQKHAGHDPARGRQPLRAPGQAGVLRRHRRSRHRQLPAARAWSPTPTSCCCPGMYVRARRRQRRARATRSSSRSRASPAIRRATPPPWWSTRTARCEARQVKTSRTVGDQWLVDDGLAAGDRVIVEGLQKIQPGAVRHGAGAERGSPEPAGRRRSSPVRAASRCTAGAHAMARFFIDRPDLRLGHRDPHHARRRDLDHAACRSRSTRRSRRPRSPSTRSTRAPRRRPWRTR